MRILVTGKGGKSGSWKMRGEQLGAAMGADVQPMATDASRYDVTVVVKRTPGVVLAAVRGRRWVWDVVDAYPQPLAYGWERDEAIRWVRAKIAAMKPTGIIWPTAKMREDCDTGLPGIVLPHHHRPGIASNPIRKDVKRVGYEGEPAYLGRWAKAAAAECKARGWEFVVNPERLADVDIVVALRDGGGYVCRNWKSAVKLANAHGSGTPFVGVPEQGYIEQASGAEYWAKDQHGLGVAFDWLKSQSAREQVQDRFLQRAYPVEKAASDLLGFLGGL